MKNRILKIKGFTLTEMLIVLTISAIVATLAFSILSLVGRNLSTIQNNYELTTSYNLVQQQLTIDFNRFHHLYYDQTEGRLQGATPLDSVTYLFSGDVILRNRDTLLNTNYSIQFYKAGTPVTSHEVDALKLNFITAANHYLFVYKQYDAAQKIKSYGN